MIVTLDDDELRAWLRGVKTIAVVGLSADPSRPSHRIASSLQFWGYTVWPVNPGIESVLGQPAFPSLASLPTVPDLVLVFRRPEFAAEVAAESVRLGCPGLWFQLDTASPEAISIAQAAGLCLVADVCLGKEYLRIFNGHPLIPKVSDT